MSYCWIAAGLWAGASDPQAGLCWLLLNPGSGLRETCFSDLNSLKIWGCRINLFINSNTQFYFQQILLQLMQQMFFSTQKLCVGKVKSSLRSYLLLYFSSQETFLCVLTRFSCCSVTTSRWSNWPHLSCWTTRCSPPVCRPAERSLPTTTPATSPAGEDSTVSVCNVTTRWFWSIIHYITLHISITLYIHTLI